MCLSRLQNLTLLAYVSAICCEERHIGTIFRSLRLYRDDLNSVKAAILFEISIQLSVVDFDAKMLRSLMFQVPL